MKKLIISLVIFIGITSSGFSQQELVGKPAPELKLSAGYNGLDYKRVSLKNELGKIVMIEFWATWCGPCVGAFGHINELVNKFKGKDVVFISISIDKGTDADQKIENVLKMRPLYTKVVKDADGLPTMKAYGISSIPATILIDKTGKISKITNPTSVNEELLNNLLEGKSSAPVGPIKVAVENPDAGKIVAPVSEKGKAPVFSLNIEENRVVGGSSSWYKQPTGTAGANNLSTISFISWIYGISVDYLVVLDSIPKKRWNMEAIYAPGLNDSIMPLLQQIVPHSIGIQVAKGKKMMDVYVLTCPDGIKPGKKCTFGKSAEQEGESHSGSSEGFITITNQPVKSIAEILGGEAGIIIADETGLKGFYDLILDFTNGELNSFITSLKESGLILTKELRETDVLFIRRAR
jgi:uncharacterized protein (TIGR03435 family)